MISWVIGFLIWIMGINLKRSWGLKKATASNVIKILMLSLKVVKCCQIGRFVPCAKTTAFQVSTVCWKKIRAGNAGQIIKRLILWSNTSLLDRWFVIVLVKSGGARLSSNEKILYILKLASLQERNVKKEQVNWIVGGSLIGLDGLWNLSVTARSTNWLERYRHFFAEAIRLVLCGNINCKLSSLPYHQTVLFSLLISNGHTKCRKFSPPQGIYPISIWEGSW